MDIGGSMPSLTVPGRFILFGMKFYPRKKSKEIATIDDRRSCCSVQHLTRRSPNITVKGGGNMGNQTEWHTPELQLRYGERIGAEELGLMCCRYLALGGDAHMFSAGR